MTAQAKRNKKNGRYYAPGMARRMPAKPDHLPPRLVSEILNRDEAPAPHHPEPEQLPEIMPDRVIQAIAGVSVGLIVIGLSLLLGDWLP